MPQQSVKSYSKCPAKEAEKCFTDVMGFLWCCDLKYDYKSMRPNTCIIKRYYPLKVIRDNADREVFEWIYISIDIDLDK